MVRPPIHRLLVAALVTVLGGCAHEAASPLPTAPDLVAVAPMHAATAAPMSVAQVTAEVLARDPDLVAARAQRGVAGAQRLQAGLLPDPAFNGAILPLVAGVGSTFAWTAGLTQDVRALVTLRARREGARAASFQVDAQLLWQEWQAAGQARLLAVQLIAGDRALRLQAESRAVFADRTARLQRALASGDVTLTTAAPDLAALQNARAQVDAAERVQLARRHQLNALMGREPDAPLILADAVAPAFANPGAVDAAAAELARRRPDLIALRLGYRAQEAHAREAILGRFPPLLLGVTGGSDNSDVRNLGPQISTTLPIFDGNRGVVAVARATRAQLRAEYQARLDQAYAQVRAGVSELAADRVRLAAARATLPGADRAAAQARRAFQSGALDELGYVDLIAAELAKRQEIVALEQAVLEQETQLATLTGAGLPAVSGLPDIGV